MKYRPQTPEVEALIIRASSLTDDEARELVAAWYATWYDPRLAALYVALHAAWDAVCALVVRDLISTDGFTQEHYDLLTGPWAQAIGPVHPDDVIRGKP